MTRRKVSNPLGLAVLSLLFERPMHPYEMAATLRHRAKEASIKLNYGSLYTVIAALERAGFVTAREKTRQGARPERTVYALTAAGDVELNEWLRELLRTPMKEYSQFEAGLSLMPVLPPDEAAGLLAGRLRLLGDEVQRLRGDLERATEQEVPPLFLIETEFLLAMREAERAWVAKLARRIAGSATFTQPWRDWHQTRGRDAGGKNREGV